MKILRLIKKKQCFMSPETMKIQNRNMIKGTAFKMSPTQTQIVILSEISFLQFYYCANDSQQTDFIT